MVSKIFVGIHGYYYHYFFKKYINILTIILE